MLLLQNQNSGLTLLKGDNSNNFTPLALDKNNNVISKPCP